MVTIHLNQKMYDAEGKEIIPSNGKAMTLKDVMINALLFPIEKETDIKKYEKYEVYKKIKNSSETVDLKTEEIALIKKWIGETQTQLIQGQSWDMIEEDKKEDKNDSK